MSVASILDGYEQQALAYYEYQTSLFIEGEDAGNLFTNAFDSINLFVGKAMQLWKFYRSRRKFDRMAQAMAKILAADKKSPFLPKDRKIIMFCEVDRLLRDYQYAESVLSGMVEMMKTGKIDPSFVSIYDKYAKRLASTANQTTSKSGGYFLPVEDIYHIIARERDAIKKLSKQVRETEEWSKGRQSGLYGYRATAQIRETIKSFIRAFTSTFKRAIFRWIATAEGCFAGFGTFLRRSFDAKSLEYYQNWMMKDDKDMNKLMKDSKMVRKEKFGSLEIEMYQLPIATHSAFITVVNNVPRIYVDKELVHMPRIAFRGIIYHEMGHLISGHLGLVNRTITENDIQFLRKKMLAYQKMMKKKGFQFSDEDTLVGLLIETEADTYAANLVGKHTMRRSLRNMSSRLRDWDRLSMRDLRERILNNPDRKVGERERKAIEEYEAEERESIAATELIMKVRLHVL